MDLFFDLLRSVIYGVIEGITEWLPISSTGHMILAEQVLKFSFSAEFMEMFRVVIQLGAILAVVVMYFKKLWPFCVDNGRDSGLAKHVRWPVMRLWFKIIVACLPAAVLGLADRKGMLEPGYDADIVLVDLDHMYEVHADELHSKSKNCPYDGALLYGKVVTTIKGGKVTFEIEE